MDTSTTSPTTSSLSVTSSTDTTVTEVPLLPGIWENEGLDAVQFYTSALILQKLQPQQQIFEQLPTFRAPNGPRRSGQIVENLLDAIARIFAGRGGGRVVAAAIKDRGNEGLQIILTQNAGFRSSGRAFTKQVEGWMEKHAQSSWSNMPSDMLVHQLRPTYENPLWSGAAWFRMQPSHKKVYAYWAEPTLHGESQMALALTLKLLQDHITTAIFKNDIEIFADAQPDTPSYPPGELRLPRKELIGRSEELTKAYNDIEVRIMGNDCLPEETE
ncbi:Uu.00g012660.m01.CDS01 [Anthostomella pinea]|uniref:Uu.00g012660.m01.CDS01 n=1 Tax=Anthostomella pinea TaxID=933095 RepID=A0AAI8VY04_9PEZI|nr:Uu.00g012660.m01.CDS01 [Anthostomella pinea]